MMSDDNAQMTRRRFLQTSIAGSAALMGLERFAFGGTGDGLKKRPNIVFILTDDQRYDAMSCAGHPFLRTPNIDRIANEGAKFNNAFVTTSLCSPSRTSFLTGLYAHKHGVIQNEKNDPDAKIPTFPQLLQKAGYETAFIGKWHLAPKADPRPGFDYWLSFSRQGVYNNPTLNINGKEVKVDGYTSDILTNYAVDWLKQQKDKPFCLYLSHKGVHGPFTPAARHSKLFSDAKMEKPKSWDDDLVGKPKWVAERQQSRHGVRSEEEFENLILDYNRTITALDDSVGRVLATLEEIGVLNNTVVIFAGDNGFFQGEHKLSDKRAMYEESIRIPFVMRYPKLVKPGTQIDPMVLNIDLCPTLLDIAEAPIPQSVQGRSFKPVLAGKTSGWREDFLYEYSFEKPYPWTPTVQGVRTERWKYIEYPEIDDKAELYDLKSDPYELHNLIDDPTQAKVLADMQDRLKRLLEETK